MISLICIHCIQVCISLRLVSIPADDRFGMMCQLSRLKIVNPNGVQIPGEVCYSLST